MNEKIDISIAIPAFNEAKRLPTLLDQLYIFCKKSKKKYEIVIVDDGSKDKTVQIAESYKDKFDCIQLIQNKRNRGKGYSVKRGLLKSKGKVCLFLDADGSVSPCEIEKNTHYIENEGYEIFVGSRVLRSNDQILKIKWYRKFIGIVFNFFVRTFLFKNIKDTQCGFKIFRKEVVNPLFSRTYLDGFGFDIEILYLAYKMGFKVKEGSISWHHVSGSKINLFTDSIKMFFNILQVRNWHCTPINTFSKYLEPNEYKYMFEMEDYHWWFISKRNLIIQLIKSLKFPSPFILDVGSGTGANLSSFSKIGKTFGIDISKQAVDFCNRRGLKNIIQSPVEKIKFKDKNFDIITCLDLLEHTTNPIDVLKEIRRVLKDSGKIIITVPAFRILWSQHDEALCHLRRYEKDSLMYDLHEAELKIEKMSYLFFTSFFVVAPIRILRRIIINKQKLYSDTTTLPPKILNDFLRFLFEVETKISINLGLPFGTTLYAIASKIEK
mgnify:CR=1 FL=1